MKKISNFIIILTFFVMIMLPQILFIFLGEEIPEDNSEKRKLADKPKLNIENMENYASDFEKYYNDHLPFRSLIRNFWTNSNFYLLNESTEDSVLIGKNDGEKSLTWLFYQDDDGANPIKETQGILKFSENEKEIITNKIISTTEEFAKRDIQTYFLVIPNKENLYREKLPENIKIYEKETRAEKIINYLEKDCNMDNIIYIKNELEEAKKENILYYRQDTHWNEYGAFVGFKAIMNKIEPLYENFKHQYSFSSNMIVQKDLSDMLGVKNVFKDTVPKVEFFEEKSYYEEIYETDNKIVITVCDNPEIDKTVLIVGDSFRSTMIPYFSKVYKKVIYLHRCDYQKHMIEAYAPDIVICQFLERYLNAIEEFDLY